MSQGSYGYGVSPAACWSRLLALMQKYTSTVSSAYKEYAQQGLQFTQEAIEAQTSFAQTESENAEESAVENGVSEMTGCGVGLGFSGLGLASEFNAGHEEGDFLPNLPKGLKNKLNSLKENPVAIPEKDPISQEISDLNALKDILEKPAQVNVVGAQNPASVTATEPLVEQYKKVSSSEIPDAEKKIQDLQAEKKLFSGEVERLEKDSSIAKIQNRIDENNISLEKARKALEAGKSSFVGLGAREETRLNEQIKYYEARNKGLVRKKGMLEASLEKAKANLATVDGNLTKAESELTALQKKQGDLKGQLQLKRQLHDAIVNPDIDIKRYNSQLESQSIVKDQTARETVRDELLDEIKGNPVQKEEVLHAIDVKKTKLSEKLDELKAESRKKRSNLFNTLGQTATNSASGIGSVASAKAQGAKIQNETQSQLAGTAVSQASGEAGKSQQNMTSNFEQLTNLYAVQFQAG